MKKIFLIVLVAMTILMSFSDGVNKPATITGKLCDYKGTGYLLLMDKKDNYDTLKVSENGDFSCEIACEKAEGRILILDYLGKDKAIVKLYITPGAKTEMKLSGEYREEVILGEKSVRYVVTPVFYGDNAHECEYVNIPPYYDYYYVKDSGQPVTYKEFMQQIQARQDFLKSKLQGCSEEFKNEALKEVNNLTMQYLFVFARRAMNDAKYNASCDEDFVKVVSKIDLNDESLFGDIGMSNIPSEYIRYELAIAHPEYYAGKADIERFMLYIRDKVDNPIVREIISDREIGMFMVCGGGEGLTDAFPLYKEISGKSEQFKENEKVFNSLKKLLPGVKATDFIMQDPQGNDVRFLDVVGKGKFTYIDFWATWCGPCCAEIPYVEKLVEHYKGNDKIEMLSISLDNSKAKWLSKLNEDKPAWRQFIIPSAFNSEFAKEYNIRAIPRFMIFDKDGKIVTINATHPSDESIIETLDSIINR